MKGENPFTLTFGQKPVEFISRTDQIGKIINTFDMENPSNVVYMIAGVRGSGKTVSLAVIGDYFAFKCRYGSDFRSGIGIKSDPKNQRDRFGN